MNKLKTVFFICFLVIVFLLPACNGMERVEAETEQYFKLIAQQRIGRSGYALELYYVEDRNGNEYVIAKTGTTVAITQVRSEGK